MEALSITKVGVCADELTALFQLPMKITMHGMSCSNFTMFDSVVPTIGPSRWTLKLIYSIPILPVLPKNRLAPIMGSAKPGVNDFF